MEAEKEFLGYWISIFLTNNLISNRGLSINTQKSYRDAFILFTRYIENQCKLDMLSYRIENFNAEIILSFLHYLSTELHSSDTTCNQRLAALKSFAKYVARSYPDFLKNSIMILDIKEKKVNNPVIDYLTKDEMEAFLQIPDKSSCNGYRDYLLFLILYNTGARVSEIVNLKISDISFGDQSYVLLRGKGRKERTTPLWKKTDQLIQDYIKRKLNVSNGSLFYGVRDNALTRHGIYEIIEKYAKIAKKQIPSLGNKKITPHTFRHTAAVHLLLSGVDINTIRALLGHSNVETTNIYASITLEMKQKAIDKCSLKSPQRRPLWKEKTFTTFLKSL